MIMNFTPEQIASTNKAGIEAILGLAHTQFSAFERLSALYFNATKAAFEEGVGHAKALLNAKDPQEYVNLNAAATQPTMEKAIAYSRDRKSTRLNSSHGYISYAVFCLKKKKKKTTI